MSLLQTESASLRAFTAKRHGNLSKKKLVLPVGSIDQNGLRPTGARLKEEIYVTVGESIAALVKSSFCGFEPIWVEDGFVESDDIPMANAGRMTEPCSRVRAGTVDALRMLDSLDWRALINR
jgi:hypothetical protein